MYGINKKKNLLTLMIAKKKIYQLGFTLIIYNTNLV